MSAKDDAAFGAPAHRHPARRPCVPEDQDAPQVRSMRSYRWVRRCAPMPSWMTRWPRLTVRLMPYPSATTADVVCCIGAVSWLGCSSSWWALPAVGGHDLAEWDVGEYST
jgi:hypothetical protein